MERRCFSFDGLGFTFGFPVFPAFPAFPASASLVRAFSLLFHCFVPALFCFVPASLSLLVARGLVHGMEENAKAEAKKRGPEEVPP